MALVLRPRTSIFADPLQMSHALPSFFGKLQNPHVLLTFGRVSESAESLAPATQNDVSTSKSSANMWGFLHLDIEICFAPQRNKLFEHLNFQNCSEAAVLVHFDFQMCFAPQRRTLFRRLQLPKVVREWCALEILTSKCASRHHLHLLPLTFSLL